MAQIKKKEMRDAILESAFDLFKENSFLKCSMGEIARAAETSVSNIYVYFPSKLHLFYEVYTPIMISRMIKLGNETQFIDDPEERLRFIFKTLWHDIPNEHNGFAYNLIQAIVTTPAEVEKPHDSLKWIEDFLHGLIRGCLPEERRYLVKDTMISFLAWMAFDGFVVNLGKGEQRDMDIIVNHFSDMLLGKSETT